MDFQESSYTFTEGESNLDLCVRLVEGSIERAFPSSIEVDLNTVDITTVGEESANLVRASFRWGEGLDEALP